MRTNNLICFENSPLTYRNNYNHTLFIKGASLELNPEETFSGIKEKIYSLIKASKSEDSIIIDCHFEFINTRSIRELVFLFKEITKLNTELHAINVVWKYEIDEEDILEVGEDLAELFQSKIAFRFVELPAVN